ncbi:MAG: diacylglycerol kinase family protein [Planctomycetota bacterium]
MVQRTTPAVRVSPLIDAPYRSALVVANPTSGQGQGVKAAREVQFGLEHRGVPTALLITAERGAAFEHLRAMETDVDLIVSVGGDGTLREVFEGLVDPEVPIAVLPFGTANVLARELGMPRDVHLFLEIVLRRRVEAIDVLRVNGRLSFLAVGVGLDGEIVRRVEGGRRGPITRFKYVPAGLASFLRFVPPVLTVTLDGERLEGNFGLALVTNTARYAGLFRIASDCRRDDGLFEVVLLPTGGRLEILAALTRGLVGCVTGRTIQLRRARSVKIESAGPVPYQVDGDFGGTTPVLLEPAPNRYRLVVP